MSDNPLKNRPQGIPPAPGYENDSGNDPQADEFDSPEERGTDNRKSASTKEEVSLNLGSNPILKKIGRLLTNSTASDWKQGGFELTAEARVPRPIQVHEFVYIRDLGEKSLIVKVATPVSCHYAPGGYGLMPMSSGNFSIELRDRVFDPEKLVDPKFAANFKGKSVDVLATGEVACKLFLDVRALVCGSSKNLQQEFSDKAKLLLETLLDSVEKSEIKNWSRTVAMVEGRDNTTYSTTHEGMALILLRSVQGWDAFYELKIKQGKFEISKSGSTPKLIFMALEQQEQNMQLESLEKKLKELGLEDDLE